MTTTFTFPKRAGHAVYVNAVGWGEPRTIYVRCTCGWQGITIHEHWYRPDETTFDSSPEPYRTLLRTYGTEILLGDNDAYGTIDDANRQGLAHLGYDLDQDLATAIAALTDANQRLTAVITDAAHDLQSISRTGAQVKTALTEFSRARHRAEVWGSAPLPTLPVRDPDAVALAARTIADHRSSQTDTGTSGQP